MFSWIVDKINSTISKGKDGLKRKRNDLSYAGNSIGLLDIFGFEKFEHNTFEQLCINYANEKLQQFFVRHVFKLEQEEYTREGIKWDKIEFTDNQAILDMIAMKPLNIFALIDEEAFYPNGSDPTMLAKIKAQHQRNELFQTTRAANDPVFLIQHFAGPVVYQIDSFLEKNRNTFHLDSINLVAGSSTKFLTYLFQKDLKAANTRQKRGKTILQQFKKSLEELMSTLESCEPFFVRCIKPNETKKSGNFDRQLVYRQLKYSGMMETIRIRKAGYPIRYDFEYFASRYDVCVFGLKGNRTMSARQKCERILAQVLAGQDCKIGNSKVFLKGICYGSIGEFSYDHKSIKTR